jgi:hypothetical protein
MSYLALARAALLRGKERSEKSEGSEESRAERETDVVSATNAWDTSLPSLFSHGYLFSEADFGSLTDHERAEVERLLAAGRRVTADAIQTTDNGEILTYEEAVP